jgi:hypothetical protein
MAERWIPIPGHPDYEVSDQGRVRSLDRIVYRKNGNYLLTGRILKPSKSGQLGKDYLAVSLGRGHYKTVHRLVLESFVGPCPGGLEACHSNGDRHDNRLNNLRWDTRSANNLDKNAHGTNYQANKTHCHRGHEFTAENTVLRPEGGRRCRTCRNEGAQRRKSTPEGRTRAAARQKEYRRRTGKITGLHNYGSRTHCKNGHEFTPENTRMRTNGTGRRCLACERARHPESNRRQVDKRKSDPAKREAWNAYMREYNREWRKRKRSAQ